MATTVPPPDSTSLNLTPACSNGSPAHVQLSAAMLADSAQIRDGTLFVLGGGFGPLQMRRFPAPFGRQAVLLLEFHASEADRDFELSVALADADGAVIQRQVTTLQPERPESLEPGEMILLPVVAGLGEALITAPGRYSVAIFVNGEHRQSLSFVAVQHQPT